MTDSAHAEGDLALLHECAAAERLIVRNRIDETGEDARVDRIGANETRVFVSALRGDGVAELRREIARIAGRGDGVQGEFSARRRHVDALQRVARHLDAAVQALRERSAGELAAEELRLAQRDLGEITGEYTSDDLLGAIFSTFCIGK